MTAIKTLEQLRNLYAEPKGRTLQKQLSSLDKHCKHFISLCRFVVISSTANNGNMDASPRGGGCGFIKAVDDNTLLIPDWAGNNRLDSYTNIIDTGKIGLLFIIAGIDETLRVNGDAELRTDLSLRNLCCENKHQPKLVIKVDIKEAYLHCAKAFMRSKLWDSNEYIARDKLPSMGQMISDQINQDSPTETQQEMVERYAKQLY